MKQVGKALRRAWHVFRSAITGRFVSRAEAEQHPDTTVREKSK